MTDWQQRVIDEAAALQEKLTKLSNLTLLVEHPECTAQDAALLLEQKTHMQQYLNVLERRIARFT